MFSIDGVKMGKDNWACYCSRLGMRGCLCVRFVMPKNGNFPILRRYGTWRRSATGIGSRSQGLGFAVLRGLHYPHVPGALAILSRRNITMCGEEILSNGGASYYPSKFGRLVLLKIVFKPGLRDYLHSYQ